MQLPISPVRQATTECTYFFRLQLNMRTISRTMSTSAPITPPMMSEKKAL